MRARLERQVKRRATGERAGLAEREDLGVRPSGASMVAAADDPRSADDDGPDGGVRARAADSAFGQPESFAEEPPIGFRAGRPRLPGRGPWRA